MPMHPAMLGAGQNCFLHFLSGISLVFSPNPGGNQDYKYNSSH